MRLLQIGRTQKCIMYVSLFSLTIVTLMAFSGCNGERNLDEDKALQSLKETADEVREAQNREFDKMRQDNEKFLRDFKNEMREIEHR